MVGTGSSFECAPDPLGFFLSTESGRRTGQQTPAAGLPQVSGTPPTRRLQLPHGRRSRVAGDGVNDTIYLGAVGRRGPATRARISWRDRTSRDTHTWAIRAAGRSPLGRLFRQRRRHLQVHGRRGTTFTSLNAGGLQTALFYNLDVKPDATASVTLGALQDNGIVTTAGAGHPAWRMGIGGDGFDVAHDGPDGRDRAYGSSNATILRSTTTAYPTAATIDRPGRPAETRRLPGGRRHRPERERRRLRGKQPESLAEHRRRGDVAEQACRPPGPPAKWTSHRPTATTWSSPSDDRFWCRPMRSAGEVSPSTDITRNLPGRTVGAVAFDPNDPATIYAVLGGFSGFPGGHVFRTSLTATRWTDISPPARPSVQRHRARWQRDAHDPVHRDGLRRAALGGWRRQLDVLDDIHFPGAPVFELVYHRGELRAATFGRGVFSFAKPTEPSIAVNLDTTSSSARSARVRNS